MWSISNGEDMCRLKWSVEIYFSTHEILGERDMWKYVLSW